MQQAAYLGPRIMLHLLCSDELDRSASDPLNSPGALQRAQSPSPKTRLMSSRSLRPFGFDEPTLEEVKPPC